MSDNVVRPPGWAKNGSDDGGDGTDLRSRVTSLQADMRDTNATLNRIEPKLDKLDDRLRTVEVDLGTIKGQMNLLIAKMPSWWQQPVTAAAIVALMAAAIALGKAVGYLH